MQFTQGSPKPQSSNMISTTRKRGPPAALRIDTPVQNPSIIPTVGDSSACSSCLSSAASEDYSLPFGPRAGSKTRNMKQLSLTLPFAQSSANSLALPPSILSSEGATSSVQEFSSNRGRRASIMSLPISTTSTSFLHRKDENGSPSVPYADGPMQIIPGVWLGSEDNARDWKGLMGRGIKSILNVAKEVVSPFDSAAAKPLRSFQSMPRLNEGQKECMSTFYPAHIASGRPAMHYLKLQWSHGQSDLVKEGFPAAMAFVDAALARGEGVLIHCQCGISRSATMAIALVMRAAATCSPSVPPEVWQVKGMQGAYDLVKDKSKWIGPNMSLIYQLLDYEKTLKTGSTSPTPSDSSSRAAEEEEEWGRRRRMLDDDPSIVDDRGSVAVMQEARALDRAMEDRMEARKIVSSIGSSNGMGMGPAWRSRYNGRKRSGSTTSNLTTGSILSEDLVEEDEEQELLGVGRFDDISLLQRSPEELSSSSSNSPQEADINPRSSSFTPRTARPWSLSMPRLSPVSTTQRPTPPVTLSSALPIPQPQSRTEMRTKARSRPLSLANLPPILPSPMSSVPTDIAQPTVPTRTRKESRKPAPPPLHLRSSTKLPLSLVKCPQAMAQTPSQTLFVFPSSPTSSHMPSTMTLTSNHNNAVPFPSNSTPRVATFRRHGRTRSYIGVGLPSTPTTACSIVDAKGWVGMQKDKK